MTCTRTKQVNPITQPKRERWKIRLTTVSEHSLYAGVLLLTHCHCLRHKIKNRKIQEMIMIITRELLQRVYNICLIQSGRSNYVTPSNCNDAVTATHSHTHNGNDVDLTHAILSTQKTATAFTLWLWIKGVCVCVSAWYTHSLCADNSAQYIN